MKVLILLFLAEIVTGSSHDDSEWDRRVIYQVVTDRFAQNPGTNESCHDLTNWCGGTFKGIESKLDYLETLGVNALWISPMVLQIPDGNFHGYAAKNIFKVDPHFGTEQDLRDFIESAHKRDFWVMLDVVPNHMGLQSKCTSPDNCEDPEDFSEFFPFNLPEHYNQPLCQVEDHTNQTEVEICRIHFLPDLNQTNPFVNETLIDWVAKMTFDLDFDGFRLDATKHMSKRFLVDFRKAAKNCMTGEIFSYRLELVASYQEQIGSVLNFPQEETLRETFRGHINMRELKRRLLQQREAFRKGRTTNFLDNHDMPYFLSDKTINQLHNVIHLFWDGIPIIYYGSEQEFITSRPKNLRKGSARSRNDRQPLWPHYNTSTPTFTLIKKLLDTRKILVNKGLFDKGQEANIVYTDRRTIVFTRGQPVQVMAVSTYDGKVSGSWSIVVKDLDLEKGARLENALYEEEIIIVDDKNNVRIHFDFPYKPKLFVPV